MLPSLDDVQAVAQDDDFIQGLVDDTASEFVLVASFVDLLAPESKYGANTKMAQSYLAAHLLSVAATDAGGRGPVSSESIGGVTRSWTLPYLNQTTVIASTQYGLMFLEVQNRTIPNFLVV